MKFHPPIRIGRAIGVGLGVLLLVSAADGEVLVEPKLTASAGAAADLFGSALAVSGDVLVATAPHTTVDGKFFAGAAYVFMRDQTSGAWV
jgi:hypothetical protein